MIMCPFFVRLLKRIKKVSIGSPIRNLACKVSLQDSLPKKSNCLSLRYCTALSFGNAKSTNTPDVLLRMPCCSLVIGLITELG